ncbi:LysR substrate binding domain protein [compost metagenome]
MGEQIVDLQVVPAICSNDEGFELEAVLAGKVLGQLAGVTAAPYIRDGRLVPILVEHTAEYIHYFVYFGSRTSQPARARAFIDLAVQRLVGNPEYILSEEELRRFVQVPMKPRAGKSPSEH